jgi:hypothetical protein
MTARQVLHATEQTSVASYIQGEDSSVSGVQLMLTASDVTKKAKLARFARVSIFPLRIQTWPFASS